MNYIGLLNDEEKVTLCIMLLPGMACKQFFVEHEQVFQRIKKGFRAKSQSPEQALLTFINNIDNTNVLLYFNNAIDCYLNELQKKNYET